MDSTSKDASTSSQWLHAVCSTGKAVRNERHRDDTNVRVRKPRPVPANGQPMTLVEIVEHEAMGYRAWETKEGDFLASQMERLSQLIRWTGATKPEDYEDRMEIYDRELRDRHYDQGYHDGLEEGRRQCRCQIN